LHYAADLRSLYRDTDLTHLERELAWHRLRAETSRTLGWVLFVMLGMAGAGWTFHPALWAGSFFGVMFFWLYASYKAFRMRLDSDDAVRRAVDKPPVTGD
jgi:hypothetical protein